ncbi:hypothetical protein AgCh_024060 [Apium graveolens]
MERQLLYSQFLSLLVGCFVLNFGESSRVLVASSGNDTSSAGLCPSNWTLSPSKQKCFRYIENSTSWEKSENHCQGNDGHLAAVDSLQELRFVQKLCGEVGNGCWVGGRSNNSTIAVDWRWSDNTSWNETIIPQTHLRSSCKNLACQNEEKLSLCTLTSTNGTNLNTGRCNSSHAYICMIYIGVVVWLLVFKRSKRRKKSRKLSNPAASALVPPSWKIFTREELRSITKNFSEGNRLLGDAKTGGTYSGLLPDGSRVAVKRLKRSSFQRKKEFYTEIGRVARLHHPNLVSMKGCCYDHGDRYIVYEFIIHGPLDRWLHHIPKGGRSLDWVMRMKVATTLAQGIAFLHDKVKPQVVHRDIRACNVLLDEDFGAHLMGVGLSKFVPWEVMHERTVMAGGTHGYLAPEFVYKNELTTKSDVYSFGVLLLEIVTGRRPAQAVDSVGYQSIFEWATPLAQSHRYLELLDPLISSSSSHIPEAGIIQKVVDLVYSCTQHVPSMRPRMSHVVHQLQQLA